MFLCPSPVNLFHISFDSVDFSCPVIILECLVYLVVTLECVQAKHYLMTPCCLLCIYGHVDAS